MRSAEGLHRIQIKNYKLQCFKLTSWCLTLLFRKAWPFVWSQDYRQTGVLRAAIQRICCPTVAVGTDLKVKPKVCGHSFADLCQHSRVRLSFWDISGWIRTLQLNKGSLQSLVSLKSRVCLCNNFSFHSHLINPSLCSSVSFPLARQAGQHFCSLWNEFLMENFKLSAD